jgi:hypothetical protein
MQRALRQAHLYGYLVEREGKLCHPSAHSAVCSQAEDAAMVREGWLKYVKPHYYITVERRIAIQG